MPSYNPQNGTTLLKPPAMSGVSDTFRYQFYDEARGIERPFASVAEANSYYDTPTKRAGHFTFLVNFGGGYNPSTGLITGGVNKEYWSPGDNWAPEEKNPPGSGGEGTGGPAIIEEIAL